MPYFIVSSETQAEAISEKFYDLRRPNDPPSDGTHYWFGWIVHSDGRAALDVTDTTDALIKPDSDPAALADDLGLEGQKKQNFIDAVEALKGGTGTLDDLLPQNIKDGFVTEAELEADGWPVGANVTP